MNHHNIKYSSLSRKLIIKLHFEDFKPERFRIFESNVLCYFSGGQLYSGTVSDFSGSDALIFRGNLRTEQYDLKHLNGK